MAKWSGVDPYLFHLSAPPGPPSELEAFPARGDLEAIDSGMSPVAAGHDAADLIPALVRLESSAAKLPALASGGFRENARLGSVVSGMGTLAALEELGKLPGVVVEVSREAGDWELAVSRPTVRGHEVTKVPGADVEDSCIVALIDGGVDVHHRAFLDAKGQSRILWIWDQTAAGETTPKTGLNLPFDYGVLHDRAAIDAAIQSNTAFPVGLRAEAIAHGTHVTSIAAGRQVADDGSGATFAGGMAPDAPIVVVVPKLRAEGDDRLSIGYSKGHVDALAFVAEIAAREKLPVVVNISAGMFAGAHDGSSTLEAAFDAFTSSGRAPGRAIVKSAGNARNDARYTRITLAEGAVRKLELSLAGNKDPALTIIEAWFSSADDLEVSVRDSQGKSTPVCSLRVPRVDGALGDGGLVKLSYERFHHDNGDSQLLITLPPTAQKLQLIFEGKRSRSSGRIDLWGEGPLQLAEGKPERTLTVPGTAHSIITVAASDSTGAEISEFSSKGPTRDERNKPEIFAPGREIRAARAGTKTEAVAMSGTSMAAPHVAGAIALLFSLHRRLGADIPNAVQVRAALIATAQKMGLWNDERGYGLLDTVALLEAFGDWR